MTMANWEIKQGDCIEVMRGMEPESAHCVVTSPPSDESWTLGSRVIHGANVEKHLLAFGYDHKGKASSTGAVVVALATMFRDVLAFPEIEEECCLRSFDSQIRHEAISHICGNQIRRLPDKQWPSVASRRLLQPTIAAECGIDDAGQVSEKMRIHMLPRSGGVIT